MNFASRRTDSGRGRAFEVESLEARRLLSVTLNQPITNVSFAQDSGPETVNLYALFADSTGSADLQFTATSSAPGVVSTAILGNNLTLNPTAGRSGFTIIKMVASDPSGGRAVNLFRVQITALAARSLDVTLDAKHRSVEFVQADHASATLSLTGPGTAVVHFGGDALKLSGALLQGSRAEMESITLSNTSGKSHLAITGARSGSGQAMIGNIIVNKSLGSLDVHKALLIGDVQASAAIDSLNVDTAQNGAISIGSGSTRMTVGSAVDENFFTLGSVSFLQATQWIDSDNVPESFDAAAVHGMLVKGNFMPGLNVSGTGVKGRSLDNVKVRGQLSGLWFVQGRTGALEFGVVSSSWRGQLGSIASLSSRGDWSGQLTAESVHQFTVRGRLSFCTITLTGAGTDLGTLTLGWGDSFLLFSTGSIGSIVSPVLLNSVLWAGVADLFPNQLLPTTPADYAVNSRIGSIRLHPPANIAGFSGTQIAAQRLGNLSLVSTNTKNEGNKFGIAAESIDSLSMQDKGRPQTFSLRKVKTAAALQSEIAAHKWVLGDLSLRIV